MRILILLFTVGVVQAQVQRIDLDQITQADSTFVIKEGKIGIGTSSPSAKLDVAGGSNAVGNTNLKISSDIYPWIDFYSANTNANNRNWRIAGVSSAYGTFEILNSSAANGIPDQSRFAITKGGAVGIGNNSPTEYGSSYVNLWLGSTGKTGYLTVYNGTVNLELNADNQGVVRTRSNHPLLFGTNETERMRITSTGNVGIGTTSPSSFSGGGLTLGSTSSGKNLILNSSSDGNNGLIQFVDAVGNDALQIGATTSLTYLYGYGSRPFALYTDGQERLRVTSSGNVGIGTTSPLTKLHINGGYENILTVGDIGLGYYNGTTDADIQGLIPGSTFGGILRGPNSAHFVVALEENDPDDSFSLVSGGGNWISDNIYDKVVARFKSNGTVGININSPSYTLHVNGSVAGVGGYVNLSDIDYKKNIYDLTDGLDKVLQLRPVTFNWKNIDYGDRINTGFIAQEVELVLPDVVLNAQDGVKSLATTDLIPILTKAMQEQQQMIDELKAQIDILINEINILKNN